MYSVVLGSDSQALFTFTTKFSKNLKEKVSLLLFLLVQFQLMLFANSMESKKQFKFEKKMKK